MVGMKIEVIKKLRQFFVCQDSPAKTEMLGFWFTSG
jgi:hypothetical protein